MAKYSQVKIEMIKPPGTEYVVYWDQSKHDHGKDTAAGKAAMDGLAKHLNVPVSELNYRSGSFQSNQPSIPNGKNVFQLTT